jgi:uncharacterized DUF497 family protein
MTRWDQFTPREIEYDFENDELRAHHITLDEAVQCFYNTFSVRKNKKYQDRFKLVGKTDGGRNRCIIFQLKKSRVVRIITGWEV